VWNPQRSRPKRRAPRLNKGFLVVDRSRILASINAWVQLRMGTLSECTGLSTPKNKGLSPNQGMRDSLMESRLLGALSMLTYRHLKWIRIELSLTN
jgi:hypothetical protein